MSSPGVASEQAVSLPRSRRLNLAGLTRYPALTCGVAVVLILIILAVTAPLIAPAPPNQINAKTVSQGMSMSHPFGTDNLVYYFPTFFELFQEGKTRVSGKLG